MWGGERDFGRDGSQSQQPSDFLVFSNIWANIFPTLMYRWDWGIEQFGETHTIWNFKNGRHTLQLGPQASCLAYFSAVFRGWAEQENEFSGHFNKLLKNYWFPYSCIGQLVPLCTNYLLGRFCILLLFGRFHFMIFSIIWNRSAENRK